MWEDYAKCLEDQVTKGYDLGCEEPHEKRPEGLTLLTDLEKTTTHHEQEVEDLGGENGDEFEALDWNLANELGQTRKKGSKKDKKGKKRGPIEETQKTSKKTWNDTPKNGLLNLAAHMVPHFDSQSGQMIDPNDILFDINKDVKFKLATDDNF